MRNFEDKLKKIRILIKTNTLLIKSQTNFSWLTGGRALVGLVSLEASGILAITGNEVYLIANNIEMPRLFSEELGNTSSVIKKEYPWQEPYRQSEIIHSITNGKPWAADADYASEFQAMRSALSSDDIENYQWLCQHSAQIVENQCRQIYPGITEFEIAGLLSKEMWSLGIEPITLLIAFDERIQNFRHPIPTYKKLDKTAMLVVCTRKWGLVASLTRLVSLGSISEDLRKRHQAVAAIDAALIAGTQPGRKIGDLFNTAVQEYERQGYAEQWQFHHQGGPTGFEAREYLALPGEERTVEQYQAFAWNPSIAGTKSEDTILAAPDSTVILSHTGNYPYIEVNIDGTKWLRPDILQL
jgi:Xaa-Pro aminopeptidase